MQGCQDICKANLYYSLYQIIKSDPPAAPVGRSWRCALQRPPPACFGPSVVRSGSVRGAIGGSAKPEGTGTETTDRFSYYRHCPWSSPGEAENSGVVCGGCGVGIQAIGSLVFAVGLVPDGAHLARLELADPDGPPTLGGADRGNDHEPQPNSPGTPGIHRCPSRTPSHGQWAVGWLHAKAEIGLL